MAEDDSLFEMLENRADTARTIFMLMDSNADGFVDTLQARRRSALEARDEGPPGRIWGRRPRARRRQGRAAAPARRMPSLGPRGPPPPPRRPAPASAPPRRAAPCAAE